MMTTRDDQCLDLVSHQTPFPDTFSDEEPAEDLSTDHGVENSLVDLKYIYYDFTFSEGRGGWGYLQSSF